MAQGMGAFAQGLANGFMMGRQLKKDREEREFKDALKAASQDVSPEEQFTVTDPEGKAQVFSTEADALKAMDGKEGFRLDHTFMVGDQSFADAEQAQFAARQANSEAGKLSRQAAVAMQYGQPQLAMQYAQAHDKIIDTNSKQAFRELEAYEKEGNIDGALQMLSRQAGVDGFKLVQNEQGRLILVSERDGKPHPALGPFDDVADFFSTLKHGATINYNNYMSVYQADRAFGLEQEKFKHQKEVAEAQLDISRGNLDVSQAGLKLREKQHEWERNNYNNPRPDVRFGYDAAGQTVPITTQLGRTPDGGWSTTVTPGQPLPGVMGRAPQEESYMDRKLREADEAANKPTPSLTDGWTPEHSRALGQVLSVNRRPPAAANTGGAAPAAPTAPRTGGLRVPVEVENDVNPYGNLPYGR